MLRVQVAQLIWNLSDRDMEDFLYETPSVRRFAGLGIEALPDGTTILNFRRRLEAHGLGEAVFERINALLDSGGQRLKRGTLVDATLPKGAKPRARAPKTARGDDSSRRFGHAGTEWPLVQRIPRARGH